MSLSSDVWQPPPLGLADVFEAAALKQQNLDPASLVPHWVGQSAVLGPCGFFTSGIWIGSFSPYPSVFRLMPAAWDLGDASGAGGLPPSVLHLLHQSGLFRLHFDIKIHKAFFQGPDPCCSCSDSSMWPTLNWVWLWIFPYLHELSAAAESAQWADSNRLLCFDWQQKPSSHFSSVGTILLLFSRY